MKIEIDIDDKKLVELINLDSKSPEVVNFLREITIFTDKVVTENKLSKEELVNEYVKFIKHNFTRHYPQIFSYSLFHVMSLVKSYLEKITTGEKNDTKNMLQ